jgi:hypothetical protein
MYSSYQLAQAQQNAIWQSLRPFPNPYHSSPPTAYSPAGYTLHPRPILHQLLCHLPGYTCRHQCISHHHRMPLCIPSRRCISRHPCHIRDIHPHRDTCRNPISITLLRHTHHTQDHEDIRSMLDLPASHIMENPRDILSPDSGVEARVVLGIEGRISRANDRVRARMMMVIVMMMTCLRYACLFGWNLCLIFVISFPMYCCTFR